MTALGPRALVGVALGLRPLCSCSPASRNAGAAPSRRRIGAPHVPASSRAAESRAAGRARRAHGRAVARDPGASWSGDWDATADEAPAYAGGDEDEDADDSLSGMPYGWSEWLNQDGFAQPLHAAQAVGLQCTRALQQFAEIWVDALLVLLPSAVPRQTVTQLVYVAVGCVALYMLKVLLTTLILVASATLGIVCLSRWLVYNGTVDARRTDDSYAAQHGRWAPDTDQGPRRGARGGAGPRASSQRNSSAAGPRYEQGDVVDVWYAE